MIQCVTSCVYMHIRCAMSLAPVGGRFVGGVRKLKVNVQFHPVHISHLSVRTVCFGLTARGVTSHTGEVAKCKTPQRLS